jgi:hypothetical protein
MGMTVDEFITERMGDIGDIVESLLLTYTAVEDDMQEDIPEFLLDLLRLSPEEGIGELIDLLDGIRTKALVGLLPIPRALGTQALQHV